MSSRLGGSFRSYPLVLHRIAALAGVVVLFSAAPASLQPAEELLVPGAERERPIAPRESHSYRVVAGEEPLLLLVEQRSSDVVVEGQGPGAAKTGVDLGENRWGPELFLLEGPGERRVEVRAKAVTGWQGRYAIRVETLTEGGAAGSAEGGSTES